MMKWGIFVLITALGFSCASANGAMTRASLPTFAEGQMDGFSDQGPAEPRKVTYRASVTLETAETESVQAKIEEDVKAMGGFVTTSNNRFLLLRVPSGGLESFIEALGGLAKVLDQEITGQDITDYYTDLEMREESLVRLRERYLAILEQAVDVEDLLRIEQELERVNSEIERIRGAIKMADQNLQFSTVTITFQEPATPGPLGWIFVGLYEGVKWLFIWD
jgi:hypothetical protein